MSRPKNHSNLLIIKELAERVGFETIVQRSFMWLACGRWLLTRLVPCNAALTARKRHGQWKVLLVVTTD